MSLSKLTFKSGLNKDQTNYASEGGWYDIQLARFRSGFPEKMGGWTVANPFSPYVGTARTLFTWNVTDGNQLALIGTNKKMYILVGSTLKDITPLRVTYTSPTTNNCFTTFAGSQNVLVSSTITSGATDGDYVTFSGVTGNPGSIPNADLNKEFELKLIGGSFYITVSTTASTITAASNVGGTNITAAFQINIGYDYTTAGYGWGAGTWGTSAWGAAATTPIYTPARLIFADNYVDDLYFNINKSAIYYWAYDSSFTTRAVLLSSITGAVAVPQQINKILFTPSGYLLALGCTEYYDQSTAGAAITSITYNVTTLVATVTTSGSHGRATGDWITLIGQAPADYASYPDQVQITVTGANTFTYQLTYNPGSSATTVGTYTYNNYTPPSLSLYYDPLLIRWSNVDPVYGAQPQVWNPTEQNSSGYLRIQAGSKIVTAVNTKQETVIFTNNTLHSLQFLGTGDVFGIQQLSSNISIMGPNAVTSTNNIVYWMGTDRFYSYSGRVDTLPCTLRQYIFNNINQEQDSVIVAGVNNKFNEIIWFYATADSNTLNRYVIYNYLEQIWYYGDLSRTTWLDTGVFKNPLATNNGYVYQHEDGVNDGQPGNAAALPIESYIQSADIDIGDGEKFMLVRRLIPDVNFDGSVNSTTPEVTLTVGVRNFPGAAESTTNEEGQSTANTVQGTYTSSAVFTPYTNQVYVRCRGRQMNFRIGSDTLNTQWQLGLTRVDARADGLRG
jgi:hypothetical protein